MDWIQRLFPDEAIWFAWLRKLPHLLSWVPPAKAVQTLCECKHFSLPETTDQSGAVLGGTAGQNRSQTQAASDSHNLSPFAGATLPACKVRSSKPHQHHVAILCSHPFPGFSHQLGQQPALGAGVSAVIPLFDITAPGPYPGFVVWDFSHFSFFF